MHHFKNFFPFHSAYVHSLQSICRTFCQANPACLPKLSGDVVLLLHNPPPFPSLFLSLPLPKPSRISYPSLSCLGYCRFVPSLCVTSYGFANLNCSIPDECCVINKALRSLQFPSRLYKMVSVGALETYFTVMGCSKVLPIE